MSLVLGKWLRLARVDQSVALCASTELITQAPEGSSADAARSSPTWGRMRVLCEGRQVADHERMWPWHRTISDLEHVAAAKLLLSQRGRVLPTTARTPVQIRCLDDYDTDLGLVNNLNLGFDLGC